jgi:hypothetical protein
MQETPACSCLRIAVSTGPRRIWQKLLNLGLRLWGLDAASQVKQVHGSMCKLREMVEEDRSGQVSELPSSLMEWKLVNTPHPVKHLPSDFIGKLHTRAVLNNMHGFVFVLLLQRLCQPRGLLGVPSRPTTHPPPVPYLRLFPLAGIRQRTTARFRLSDAQCWSIVSRPTIFTARKLALLSCLAGS